jgi:Glycolipid transfer protein (GLTP)
MAVFLIGATTMTLLSTPDLVDARVGFMRTKTGKLSFNTRSDSYGGGAASSASSGAGGSFVLIDDDDVLQSLYSELATTTTRTATSNANTLTTEVGILAKNFQQAIQAINQDEEQIHVGHLLLACDKLQHTMRQVGFNQGANDIAGNIGKIRTLYDVAPPSQRDSMPALLKYELETGVHGEPLSSSSQDQAEGKKQHQYATHHIKDKSATMGFLWLGRALHYQYDMFNNMLDRDEEPYEAAARAYETDLKPHHSWAVQKICQAALGSLRPMRRATVFARIGGFEEETFGNQEDQATRRDLKQMMESWKPMLSQWKKIFDDFGLDSI